MNEWSSSPKVLSEDLRAIKHKSLDDLAAMFGTQYVTDKNSFQRGIESFFRDDEITPAGLYAYTRSIHTFYGNFKRSALTIGEVAFIAARNPYIVGETRGGRVSTSVYPSSKVYAAAVTLFRKFENPEPALAWLALLFDVVPDSAYESFDGIDFDTAARYVTAGARSGHAVKMMAESGIDLQLAQSVVNG